MSKVAVIGNTARAIGAVCASDLTLSGHEVRYTVFPEQQHQLAELREAGGFTVEGDAQHLISKESCLQVVPPFQPDIWREWEAVDLPYATVPCVQLADQAGIAAPLHRAFAGILGVLLGVDPWQCGPSLADMDLEGSPQAVKKRVRGLR